MDTNTIVTLQQIVQQHPEIQVWYQRHSLTLMTIIGWVIREWHVLGGLPAIQTYFDSRDGGIMIWLFKTMLGSPKKIPTTEQVVANAAEALSKPTPK